MPLLVSWRVTRMCQAQRPVHSTGRRSKTWIIYDKALPESLPVAPGKACPTCCRSMWQRIGGARPIATDRHQAAVV